ncbi:unnamed protein product, partial [Discosporangium mesarthrocarpum]
MEALKSVLLRENYIERIKVALEKGKNIRRRREPPETVVGLLDMIRIATVETVEAIQAWRRVLGNSTPFTWNGINYLLKIPSDLDFLDQFEAIRSWLGFSMARNPFIVPTSLEQRSMASSICLLPTGHESPMDVEGFTVVGGKNKRFSKSGSTRRNKEGSTCPQSQCANVGIVGDMDMLRVREAEKVILQEEEIHGRYTQNSSARLVPAGIASREAFRQDLQLDNHRDLASPAQAPESLAPYADVAGVGCIASNGHFTRSQNDTGTGPQLGQKDPQGGIPGVSRMSGAAISHCIGGKLHPLSMADLQGRKRRPIKRYSPSVGAKLETEILRRRQQNHRLQKELQELRCSLAKAQEDLECSRVQAQESAGSGDLSSEQEGFGEGDISRKEVECSRKALELRRCEEEVAYRAKKLKGIQDQQVIFKRNEKRQQNLRRGLILERKRRLLGQGLSGQRQTLAPSEYTIEDDAATQLQRLVRGVQARSYVKGLKPILNAAATKIQGVMRGHLGRSLADSKRRYQISVTAIQRVWRGHVGRAAFQENRVEYEAHQAARTIQRVARGRNGRRRVQHKQSLLESARLGSEAVGVTQLFHQDIVELADAIEAPLLDGSRDPPPGVVLGLLWVVELMLVANGSPHDEISHYSTVGVRSWTQLQPAQKLTWRGALRLLRRTSKLIRRLRQLAEGPASTRPRLLCLSHAAVQNYQALRNDQGWGVTAMGQVGQGAKACQQLTLWVKALQEVFAYQLEFAEELGMDRPAWVKRARSNARRMRSLLLERTTLARSTEVAGLVLSEARGGEMPKSDPSVTGSLDHCSRKGDLKISVAGKAEASLKMRLRAVEEAITSLKEEEEAGQRGDVASEQYQMHVLTKDLERAQSQYEEAKERFAKVQSQGQDGNNPDQGNLPRLLDAVSELAVKRRECWAKVELARIQQERNAKRRGVDVTVSGDLRYKAQCLGDLEAALAVAEEDLHHFRTKLGIVAEAGQTGDMAATHVSEMQALLCKEVEAREQVSRGRTELEQMQEDIEAAFARMEEDQIQREETVSPHEWDEPTAEEYEEDMHEDAQCALLEMERMKQFVREEILSRPFERPKPLVVCVSRDVPSEAKQSILQRMFADLPGLMMHIDDERSMGLHLDTIQKSLSARYSVVCDVDIGVGERARRSFLQHAAVVREALIPLPSFILVAGDDENRSGTPLELHLGCSNRDLSLMKDGSMKRYLQDAARAAHELQRVELSDKIVSLGQEERPPSATHLLVLEAVTILLTPQNSFNITPFSGVSGVSWIETSQLLQHPAQVQAAIAAVDIYSIPPYNLSTLQEYIAHDLWLTRGCATISDDEALVLLSDWVFAVVNFSALLMAAGGKPAEVTPRSPVPGLFCAVVKVHDGDSFGQELDPGTKRGWMAAYFQLLGAVLEDVRAFRVAKHIPGSKNVSSGVHMIEAFQDCGRIFFRVYNPQTSVSHFCSMDELQVSYLLAPVLNESSEFGPKTVPKHREDMFSRLTALLSFQVLSRTQVRFLPWGAFELTCQRRLRRLLRETRHISGHLATVTIYEEAKGELRCHAYIPFYSTSIECCVDATTIESILPDSSILLKERDALESEDAEQLLTPIADRLAITPAFTVVVNMGRQTKTLASRGTRHRCQDFQLRVRRKGGPGRLVFRRVYRISGSHHVVTVLELGRGGILRVSAYNQKTAIGCEVRISFIERACLGYGDDNWRSWSSDMLRRLSLRRPLKTTVTAPNKGVMQHSERTLIFDTTLFSSSYRIAEGHKSSKLLRVQAVLEDAGDTLAVEIYRAEECSQGRLLLTAAELAAVSELLGFPETIRDKHAIEALFSSQARRENAMQRLMRYLIYCSDDSSITLSIGDISKTVLLAIPTNTDKRRPQSSLCEAVSRSRGYSNSQPKKLGGLRQELLHRNRQPDTLRYSFMYGEEELEKKKKKKDQKQRRTKEEKAQKKKEAKREKKGTTTSSRHQTHTRPFAEDFEDAKTGNDHESSTQDLQSEKTSSSKHSPQSVVVARQSEKQVFKEAVKVRIGGWEQHQPTCDVVVTVFESPTLGGTPTSSDPTAGTRYLRLVVYYPKIASCADTLINGEKDLREVTGPLRQELLQNDTDTSTLFRFICHERMAIIEGIWDGDNDCYVGQERCFTLLLKRFRLYRSIKQTPIHLSGSRDAEANSHHLIEDKDQRGSKVFRRTLSINGTLFQVTAYELVGREDESEVAPSLKYIAYEPKKQTQLVVLATAAAVLELCGGQNSPWLAVERRTELAGIVADSLRIKFDRVGEPALVLPWSGEHLGFVDETFRGEHIRRVEEKHLCRTENTQLDRLAAFSARISDFEVVVTVYVEAGARKAVEEAKARGEQDIVYPTLIFNIYCPKISESTELEIPHSVQKAMTG